MTATQTEPRICSCGCGQEVIGSRKPAGEPVWKRGHHLKTGSGKLTALPGPEDDLDGEDDIDAGEVYPDRDETVSVAPGAAEDDLDIPDWLREINTDGWQPKAEPEPEITADRPPGRLTEQRGTKGAPKAGKPKIRATANVRKDVEAKIRFVLMPAGQVWAARDKPCGLTFIGQEPEISSALAEIVCDSPDLLAWFTGPAGGFMKYFRLLMACQPVAVTMWMHHIAHAQIITGDPTQPPQQEAYAA